MPSGLNFWYNRIETACEHFDGAKRELIAASADLDPDDGISREATRTAKSQLLTLALRARKLAEYAETLSKRLPKPIEDR